ncbi:MAG: hypothetical protein KDK71_10200 [Chlamydiia bacterium]|nr:hypothetical protein [Chlamydiia bacterium]USN88964.1 MAG: hypothetical protein H6780_00875 [Candidatus Nomurabacteria bacterium]
MIRKKTVYNLIRVCEIYYESENVVLDVIRKYSFHSARVYSYLPMNLPDDFKLSRVKKTTRIFLTSKTDEDILLSFKKNYRNEIRKTYKENYSFKLVKGFSEEGYSLYDVFEKESNRPSLKRRNANGIWALGCCNGKVVSGIYLIDANPVLKVISIFSSRKHDENVSQKDIGYISKRLIYEVCCFGGARGFEYVDLAYINMTDESKSGINRFKLGFGGDIVDEYLYERHTRFLSVLKSVRKNIGL